MEIDGAGMEMDGAGMEKNSASMEMDGAGMDSCMMQNKWWSEEVMEGACVGKSK